MLLSHSKRCVNIIRIALSVERKGSGMQVYYSILDKSFQKYFSLKFFLRKIYVLFHRERMRKFGENSRFIEAFRFNLERERDETQTGVYFYAHSCAKSLFAQAKGNQSISALLLCICCKGSISTLLVIYLQSIARIYNASVEVCL